jgi:hypothetical protein
MAGTGSERLTDTFQFKHHIRLINLKEAIVDLAGAKTLTGQTIPEK